MINHSEIRELDRAMRLPAWGRLMINDPNGTRFFFPHELCLLQELFEDAVKKHLADSEFAELGVTLGVLLENDSSIE